MAFKPEFMKDAEVIGRRIEDFFSGRYLERLVLNAQRCLEAMRPLPTTFEDVRELMKHLEVVSSVVMYAGAGTSRSETIRKCVAQESRWFEERFDSRWSALAEGQADANMFGPLAATSRWTGVKMAMATNPADRVVASTFGGGDHLRGWERAWTIARTGSNGGIRRLRHLIIVARIKAAAVSETRDLHRDILALAGGGPSLCLDLAQRSLNCSGLLVNQVCAYDLVLDWNGIVSVFVEALMDSKVPSEMA